MRRLYFCFMAFALLLVCVSCTGTKGDETYVYYFTAQDNNENGGIVLHAVMKKNDNKKGEDDNLPFTESFEGADIKDAFSAYFEKYKDVYTNTVKEYGISDAMGNDSVVEFMAYLVNSPGLPVKKKTVRVQNIDEYIAEKLAELTK